MPSHAGHIQPSLSTASMSTPYHFSRQTPQNFFLQSLSRFPSTVSERRDEHASSECVALDDLHWWHDARREWWCGTGRGCGCGWEDEDSAECECRWCGSEWMVTCAWWWWWCMAASSSSICLRRAHAAQLHSPLQAGQTQWLCAAATPSSCFITWP